MANVSLARIMFGTSQDSYLSQGMRALAFASPTTKPADQSQTGLSPVSGPATFSELLHKAWSSLSSKS